jgi:Nup93/Nic96
MEMNGFFEHMRAGRYAEAWAISDRLELLPRSQSDVAVMENKYRNLDDSVKRVYPFLLLAAMETLYHEYTRIKMTDLQGPNASVARERLLELKEKGHAIETFAGLLGGFEQMGHISNLAAHMV